MTAQIGPGSPSHDRLVLITGGAGFIGSHVADRLLALGYRVRVLDNLDAQVHGTECVLFPSYLSPEVEAIRGDVRNARDVAAALKGVDAVFHFASAVGVGQSMYEIERYTDVNNRGTAVLLEGLLQHRVSKLVVASSMSVYGEGEYRTVDGRMARPAPRSARQLKAGDWELSDEKGRALQPLATSEDKPPAPQSVYALSKYDQETLCLLFGRAYNVPVAALRFFNVYGERQALTNPYTGVLAIFASRFLNGKPPLIFEDGQQRRDFVHVRDLARACVLALECEEARDVTLNVGSGRSYSVIEVAERLGKVLGRGDIVPRISGQYRAGDIRHCFADISRATSLLGYRPQIDLDSGLAELSGWLAEAARDPDGREDRSEAAANELRARGLVA
jgi:dTDP-L-rhamnose 4-epimerase